jgi:hypothetical protein
LAPQQSARPRSMSQPNKGMLNQKGIGLPQAQREAGVTMEMPWGMR